MAIYRGPGGSGDATDDAASAAALVIQKVAEATASADAASQSASAAGSSAASAAISAASASASAAQAAGFVPSVTGNAGKYLTTDGSITSWSTVDALPTQTGNNGKYLTTDGSNASWVTIDVGVTSVALTAPTGLTVSGSPVTSTGTLALSFTAGYSIPTTASQANWDTAYTDRLKWDGGATGLVAATARTSLGLGTAATTDTTAYATAAQGTKADTAYGWGNHASAGYLTTALAASTYAPLTGTGASGTWGINVTGNAATVTNGLYSTGSYSNPTWLTSVSGSIVSGNISGNAANVTSTVAIANGGTGLTSTPTNGQIDIGNGTGFTRTALTAGTGISITNGAGSITIASSVTPVTSVTGTSPVTSSGGTTPAISLASGYGDTQNPYASKTANYVLAAPNGLAGVPTFRAIVAADIPTLNQNTTGSSGSCTGNAATVTNGIYTTGSYSDPTWLTALSGSKITGTINGGTY